MQEGDLNAFYSACELFVFPSLHEGFGLPVAEAMACGAPAIASNTTSLPEVMGRPDVTFDPSDPDESPHACRKCWKIRKLRDELAAYGPVQAGRFTWKSSAARAWDALEQIQVDRLTRGASRATSVLLPRPHLAFISPFPSRRSGLSDDSRQLVAQLARHYDITLVAEANIKDARLQAFPILDAATFLEQADRFDRVLYQIGNSPLHRFQIEELLPKCPGVVVLHDAFLSDYMNWRAHDQARPNEFRTALLRSHGYPALGTMRPMDATRQWRNTLQPVGADSVHRGHPALPAQCGDPAAAFRRRCHQRHSGDTTFARTLAASVPRGGEKSLGLNEQDFLVCSFGLVSDPASLRLLAEAWGRTGLVGQMVFVNDAAPTGEKLTGDAAACVQFTGQLHRDQQDKWLAACDLAVQWSIDPRHDPAVAVEEALMAGLPLIVSDSVEGFPGDVAFRVPSSATADDLARAIVLLHGDLTQRNKLSAAASDYALREMAPESIARRYHQAIESAYATPAPAVIAQRLLPEVQADAAPADGLLVKSHAIARSFAHPGEPAAVPAF